MTECDDASAGSIQRKYAKRPPFASLGGLGGQQLEINL